jgi:hypothetical protein
MAERLGELGHYRTALDSGPTGGACVIPRSSRIVGAQPSAPAGGSAGTPGGKAGSSHVDGITGTVTGPVTVGQYQVGRWAVVAAELVLILGVAAFAVAVLTPASLPPWPLPTAVLGALVASAALSLDDDRARGSVVTRVRLGLARAVWPRPAQVPPAGTAARTTRYERFPLVERTGSRVTCEFLGQRRKRAPEQGAVAEVWARRLADGTLRVIRMVDSVDGGVFRPRADLGFRLARLGTGAGTAAGAALLLAGLLLMTVRTS